MTKHPVVEVYHATCTGIDDKILESFRSGAREDMSDEHRLQGMGFYVFTKREGALAHFDEVLKKPEGLPLIMTVEAEMDPSTWKLDVEAHAHILSRFVYDNFDAVYDIFDGFIKTDRGEFCPSKSYKDPEREKMVMRFKDNRRWRQKTYPAEAARNEENGVFFADLIKELSNVYPEEVSYAEQVWLENAVKSSQVYALKYIGYDPLPVKSTDVFMEGRWVQHEL